jgi:hypothetical protein
VSRGFQVHSCTSSASQNAPRPAASISPPLAERIGDHAKDIAERMIFILTVEDIRHAPRMRSRDLS